MTNNLNVFSGNLNAGTAISKTTLALPSGRTSGRAFSNMFIPKAGGAITLCGGGTAQLNATGALSYVWSPATGLSASNIANPIATPSATTTYTVTGTDGNGCVNTATSTITVTAKPQSVTATATPASIFSGAKTNMGDLVILDFLSSIASSKRATP